MARNDKALLVGGLAVGGGLLYALTRSSSKRSTSPGSRTLPTGSYWNPHARATIGEVDPFVLEFTKGWVWPVETESRDPWREPVVSNGYHYRSALQRWHNGVDVMYKRDHALARAARVKKQQSKWYDMWPGTRAIASGPGRVVAAGHIKTGGRVRIDHGHHVHTAYLHLDRVDVKRGDTVKAGNILGTVGRDGGLYHMHFEIWFGFLHKVLDPAPYLKQWGTVGRRAPLRVVT